MRQSVPAPGPPPPPHAPPPKRQNPDPPPALLRPSLQGNLDLDVDLDLDLDLDVVVDATPAREGRRPGNRRAIIGAPTAPRPSPYTLWRLELGWDSCDCCRRRC